MRWIFRYNEQAAKYLAKLTKTKMKVEPQPWLHVAVKTVSNRNPWAGFVIFVWDTREIVGEYRSNKGLFTTEQFKLVNCGMQRAVDNHQPLVGGRKDVNEFFEFGDFDASHSDVFGDDGKRVTKTPLYTRRAKKAGLENPGSYGCFATEAKDMFATRNIWLDDKAVKLLGLQRVATTKPEQFKQFSYAGHNTTSCKALNKATVCMDSKHGLHLSINERYVRQAIVFLLTNDCDIEMSFIGSDYDSFSAKQLKAQYL